LIVDVWALAVAAAVIAGYAAVSGRLENTPITAAIVFVATGFVQRWRFGALPLPPSDSDSQAARD